MNRTLLSVGVVFGTSSLLLVDSAIKGAVILALAAFAAVLLRRDSAATRHLVWLVAIAMILGASVAIPIAMLRAADEPWNPPSATHVGAKEPFIESQRKTGVKLQPASEQKLEWGEPVNGLRMALAWPPTLGEPAAGEVPDLYLAVQNVSEAPVRLCTTAEATMRRGLLFSTNGVAQARTISEQPNGLDTTLGPREVVFLRLFVESAKDTRDWQPAEASALLSDIAAVSDSPLVVGSEEIAAA